MCTVFEMGTFAGNCILPATKPGEDQLLPHALETGVRITCRSKPQETKTVALRLSEGFCYSSIHKRQETVYHIANAKKEEFEFLLDHDQLIHDSDVDCSIHVDGQADPCPVKERLERGIRVSFKVEPERKAECIIVESKVEESRVSLAAKFLHDHIVQSDTPLASDPGVKKCLEIQQQIDRKSQEIADAGEQAARLAQKQERLRKNIKSGGHDEQTAEWRVELGTAEKELTQIEETKIPSLKEQKEKLQQERQTALTALSAEWQE